VGVDPAYTLAGWREWVSLPGVGVPWVKAKLDTGARTSAIHAFDVEEVERDGAPWVRFSVHPWQDSDEDPVETCLPVLDVREVRSSSGHAEERLVVPMTISIVERDIEAEVTLSRRDELGFRMLVGREALRQGFAVDPGRSYLGPRPPASLRRRNRGR
jgi:hypothetical protein